MLLRQSPPTPDPDLYLTMSATTNAQPEPPPTTTTPHDTNENETDSIWGSPSPPTSPSLHPNHPNPQTNETHPSDIPRLQQSHTTAGYRDGITHAKASSVQPGFDEGFSLGATIGARAGELLGVLEGVVSALLTHPSSSSPEETQRLTELLVQARKELSVQVVFGREYWEEDGTWKYEVPDGGEGVVFGDVAGAHPMVGKWEGVVRAEGGRYGVDWDVLRGGGDEARRMTEGEPGEEGVVVAGVGLKGTGGGRGVLEW